MSSRWIVVACLVAAPSAQAGKRGHYTPPFDDPPERCKWSSRFVWIEAGKSFVMQQQARW